MRVIAQAPAKLNLLLAVEPRIVNGKHPLVSVFTTIGLSDTLVFDFEKGADAPTLEVHYAQGIDAFDITPEENTVLRAAQTFASIFENDAFPVGLEHPHITLEKRIPHQAGLGGGSSDAAAVLRVLAQIAGVDLKAHKLVECARGIGADVPFFLTQGCALMTGFGDELKEILPMPHLEIVIVKPAEGVSTKEVYRAFDELRNMVPVCEPLVDALKGGAAAPDLSAAMTNNLEAASIKMLNTIAIIKEEMNRCEGVIHAMMAGSGSAVFGICDHASRAQQVSAHFAEKGYWTCATTTSTASEPIWR